ncbi:MAG: SPFH domain-containing protein [Phycisphaerae bacterium]|jgi:regulator of protease activity HflC (stomatin/prohibitin superfamily)
MQTETKRAGVVCVIALVLSVIFFLSIYVLSKFTGVVPLYAISWQILAAAAIWAILAVQFYQRFLAEQEKLDMAQLEKASGDTIFEEQKNHSELFAVAQNRLRIFEKWFLPVFSIIVAVYQLFIGVMFVRYLLRRQETPAVSHLLVGAVLMVAIAFLSFLFSLYATGLSSQAQWRPLRAGGSYFLIISIMSFATAAAMAFAQFKVEAVLSVMDWVAPIVILLLGLEMALNFVFDIYRPRQKGQYAACAYDSRLLAALSSPGNILQTAATAIDYQFGFKVSQTWFYKIVAGAVVPLVIVSAVILYSLSCILIVGPESQAIIERFGSAVDSQGKVRLVEPGITFKLPWPFDVAQEFATREIQEIHIGYVPDDDPEKEKELLWGTEHYKAEYNLLVATENIGSQEKGAVPVSIIRAAIPVQYRVVNLYKYLYKYADSRKILEAVCNREVVKFAAGARIEPESENAKSNEESLLGAGRAKAADELVRTVQAEADRLELGVEIVFMGLQGFHPPPAVAQDFQAVIGSVQKKQAAVLEAIAQRDWLFTMNVGSVQKAEDLYGLADKYMEAAQAGDKKETDKLKLELDSAFSQASGELFAKLRQARSYSYEKATLAEATGKRFAQQLEAYRASKVIYKHELKMSMLEESLAKIRKYIVVADGDKQVTVVDLQEKLMPSLYDIEPVK